ncbi:MAG: alpha/beta hydrolase [Lachnospiraceae bacterium]|nr:alpha/beta hydrolase [Lachnospiraceae bacterium]
MNRYYTLRDGQKLCYEDVGNGSETIVFLHGWSSSRKIYRKPSRSLSGQARCICYDQRGHGKSRHSGGTKAVTMETLAEDLHDLLSGLHLYPVTLAGWSMGAGVIMNYIKRYGCDGIRQTILCDMPPKQLNDATWHLGLFRGAYTAERMGADAGKDFFSLYLQFAQNTISRKKHYPAPLFRLAVRLKLTHYDVKVLASLSDSMKQQDNRDVIPQFTCPVTYFYADPGTLFLPKLKDWYRDHVTAPFRAVAFPESSHLLISEYPQKFAAEVAGIISGNG